MIDLSTEFGQRVARRLVEEGIIWLTTVDSSGVPQPRPVWFLWDGKTFLIYSRPGTAKLRHIAGNPRVALNLDGDGKGGDIVTLIGRAEILHEPPPADQVPAYIEKYAWGMERLNMTAAEFSQTYSAAIRITPIQLRGH